MVVYVFKPYNIIISTCFVFCNISAGSNRFRFESMIDEGQHKPDTQKMVWSRTLGDGTMLYT